MVDENDRRPGLNLPAGVAAFSGFVYITQKIKGVRMSTRKSPRRMTKKQFVKIVARGTLSADQVIGKMVDELQL